MRKIDYTILASVIRQMSQIYDKPTLERLAHNFANRASVDKEKFLRECGL